MANYTIGLSGLSANSQAIDTISTNIANASTVGYKAGDQVFQDQFFKAINPSDPGRSGQGTSVLATRRNFNAGTVQNTNNPLDLAITGGNGMYRLQQGEDATGVFYTRNGQFSVSKEANPIDSRRAYIVNENGMYLTGYTSIDGVSLSDSYTNRLTMPPTSLDPKTTERATLSVSLDTRQIAFSSLATSAAFDPRSATTYNNIATQTVYSREDNGRAQTLTSYFRRIEDTELQIAYNGTNFTYPASPSGKPEGVISANVTFPADVAKTLELISAPNQSTTITAASTSTVLTLGSSDNIEANARVVLGGVDQGLVVSSLGPGENQVTLNSSLVVTEGEQVEFFNPSATLVDKVTDPADGVVGTPTAKMVFTNEVGATKTTLAVASGDVTDTNIGALNVGDFLYRKDGASIVLIGQVTAVDSDIANNRVFTFDRLLSTANDVDTDGDGTADAASLSLANVATDFLTYRPVTYSMTTQDGSKIAMSGNLFNGASQNYKALVTQYEVYASLNGTFYNHTEAGFYSDNVIPRESAYKPVALMQFWGGKNIDALVFDEVTGQPAFETKVGLTGRVTSSGNTAGGLDPELVFDLNLTDSSAFATPFSVNKSDQDGYPVTVLNTVAVDEEGRVVGTYADGRNYLAGQLVLVNFTATTGLVPSGNNVYAASTLSGGEQSSGVIVGKPGARGLSLIRAGAVEASNVDLASELVKLLIQQRQYAANSQSLRAFDETLSTTIRTTGG